MKEKIKRYLTEQNRDSRTAFEVRTGMIKIEMNYG